MRFCFNLLVITYILITLTGCPASPVNNEPSWKDSVLKTDKEFSELSKQKGMKKAFIEYIDDDGVLLRPGYLPIIGANAIQYLTETNDSLFTLTWVPSSAQVAASGDLGYTYGLYNLSFKDTTLQGTYISIWKKKKNGKWKFVLDSGNPGTDLKLQ